MNLYTENFATQEQMQQINKLYHFIGSFEICKLRGQENEVWNQFAITGIHPTELDQYIEVLYNTADLADLLRELPQTVVAEKNGKEMHYYVELDHYYHTVSYSYKDVVTSAVRSNNDDVLKVFTGNTLIDAVVNAIVWVQTKRKENDGFVIKA